MKKLLETIAGIMLLLSMASMAFAQAPELKVLQTWYYNYAPSGTTLPNGFKEKTSVWVNTSTKKSYNYTSASGWVEVQNGLYVAGPKGDQGIQGPAGPQGIPGSGGGGLPTAVGTIRFCYNESDLRSAISGIVGGSVTWIILASEISITSTQGPLALPKNYGGADRRVIFSFNGQGIYDRTSTGLPYVIGMQPTDQTEANNMANRPLSYHFTGGKMVGTKNGTKTGVLLDIACSQFCLVDNMIFENADRGVRLRWCMFSAIRNCNTIDIRTTGFFVSRGDWSGSSNNNSCSNHTLVEGCRVFNLDGAFAAYQVYACSGVIIRQCTSEGGNPQYAIHNNNQAANEIKSITIETIHCESYPTVAVIYSRGGGGFQTIIRDLNLQLFGSNPIDVIVAEEATSGHTVIVSNITWLTTPCRFKSIGNTFWEFDNCYDGANLFTQARWNGTIAKGQSSYNDGSQKLTVKKL